MYCANCGRLLAENAKFCADCGAPAGARAAARTAAAAAAPVNKRRLVGIITVSVAALLVVVIVLTIALAAGGRGRRTIDGLIADYFTAFERGDEKAVMKMMMPKMIDLYESFGYDRDDYLEDSDYWYDMYGAPVGVWEIGDIDEDSFDDSLEDMLSLMNIRIRAMAEVSVDAEIDGRDCTFDFMLLNYRGRWYIVQVY